MTDARHDRHGACRDRAREFLVVERHEVLERTAAAHEQDAIDARYRGGAAKSLDKLDRGSRSLHLGTHTDDLDQRVPAPEGTLDVVDDRARERGHHGHARAERRNLVLTRTVHEPLALELAGELCHLLAKQPLPREREAPRDEAHAPLRLVDIELPAEEHLHAVAKIESALGIDAAPDGAIDGRAIVLDLKIAMAGAGVGTPEPRDLAEDRDGGQRIDGAGRKTDGLRNAQRGRIARSLDRRACAGSVRAFPRELSAPV